MQNNMILVIYPGRFQPFYQGHYAMIKEGSKCGKHLLIAISRANGLVRDNRNPFSGDDRYEMIDRLWCMINSIKAILLFY